MQRTCRFWVWVEEGREPSLVNRLEDVIHILNRITKLYISFLFLIVYVEKNLVFSTEM